MSAKIINLTKLQNKETKVILSRELERTPANKVENIKDNK